MSIILGILGDTFTIMPVSTLVVIIMALTVNIIYSAGRRLLTDVEYNRRVQAEMKQFHKDLRDAVKIGDKAKEGKLRKRKPQMDKLQAKMTFSNMKVTFLFFIPLMGLWWLVREIVGPGFVAVTPIPINILILTIGPLELGGGLDIFWWYMICSFALSGIITKLFGVSLTV